MPKVKNGKRKHPLLSRKFWGMVIGAVAMPINQAYGIELPVEALAVMAVSIAVYILTEGRVDMESIRDERKDD